MEIIHETNRDRFIATSGDWMIDVSSEGASITIAIISTRGDYTFNSGTNLDNLVGFINAVKTECIANGMNWSGN